MHYKHAVPAFLLFFVTAFADVHAQIPPQLHADHLSVSFHAGRRQALRESMPANSVAVIFSFPERVFSNDVHYVYHPNPDLYYFSGYREPNAALLIFKETQHDATGSYNELFFVQHRDAAAEQWTGRRLGVEGVKATLGFERVYNSDTFPSFALDLKKFNLLYDELPDTSDAESELSAVVSSFVEKSGAKPSGVSGDLLSTIYQYATPANLPRVIEHFRPQLNSAAAQHDPLIRALLDRPDSVGLVAFRQGVRNIHSGPFAYNTIMHGLRGVKTAEELTAMEKAIWISSIAHSEAMKAVTPTTSESELEGIMRYVHKHYGAEDEGYPPIVGAGANGCILHYEENSAAEVKNQMIVMDVGAQYQGYSADVTRSFPGNGKFSPEQKAIYQLVYDAQEQVFPLCKQGTPYRNLQKKTVDVLTAGLLKLGIITTAEEVYNYYPHGVSHHLGLDVHDRGAMDTLVENMVITVEPGIYIPPNSQCDKKWWNIGVRIEDDVVVGKTGCRILSLAAPRTWQDVEKEMAAKSFFDAASLPPLK